MNDFSFCDIDEVPEEIYYKIKSNEKVEHVVSKLQTYKRLGIQVIHLTGHVSVLPDCIEFIAQLSKDVSIYIDETRYPKILKRFIENVD